MSGGGQCLGVGFHVVRLCVVGGMGIMGLGFVGLEDVGSGASGSLGVCHRVPRHGDGGKLGGSRWHPSRPVVMQVQCPAQVMPHRVVEGRCRAGTTVAVCGGHRLCHDHSCQSQGRAAVLWACMQALRCYGSPQSIPDQVVSGCCWDVCRVRFS